MCIVLIVGYGCCYFNSDHCLFPVFQEDGREREHVLGGVSVQDVRDCTKHSHQVFHRQLPRVHPEDVLLPERPGDNRHTSPMQLQKVQHVAHPLYHTWIKRLKLTLSLNIAVIFEVFEYLKSSNWCPVLGSLRKGKTPLCLFSLGYSGTQLVVEGRNLDSVQNKIVQYRPKHQPQDTYRQVRQHSRISISPSAKIETVVLLFYITQCPILDIFHQNLNVIYN